MASPPQQRTPPRQQNGAPNQSPGEPAHPAAPDGMAEGDGRRKWKLSRFLDKAGIDAPTLVLMLKGSIPPTVGIAMYQSTVISQYFKTEGYLIPIISVLAVAILPRERFIQLLFLNILSVCIGSAMSLLVIWSSIQARDHTSTPSVAMHPPPYNSSQSAICGIWLFVNIWFANFLRAKIPSLNLPVVIYSILVNTSATTGPTIATTNAAESFVRELLLAMLFGLGLATAVALFIVPIGSRTVVLAELKSLTTLLRRAVNLQRECLSRLAVNDTSHREASSMATGQTKVKLGTKLMRRKPLKKAEFAQMPQEEAGLMQLRQTIREIRLLASKLWGDMPIARRSLSWGHLSSEDMHETFILYGDVTVSIMAMSTVMDIFKRFARVGHQNGLEPISTKVVPGDVAVRQGWKSVMEEAYESLDRFIEPISEGLQHAGICLDILPRPKGHARLGLRALAQPDVESGPAKAEPGDYRFGKLVIEKLERLMSTLTSRTTRNSRDPVTAQSSSRGEDSDVLLSNRTSSRNQLQADLMMYTEHLVYSIGVSVQNLVRFADTKVTDGTMARRRFIVPPKARLWKWLTRAFAGRESAHRESPDILEAGYVSYGSGFQNKKDAERLPATSFWQRVGNQACKFSATLGSKESAFGLRVACATMTVGILAFLEATQTFFQQQRLYWAMITIALGMTITSGQSMFGFFCRVGGTCLAMVLSLVNWYIADQKTAGVIVFLWLFIFLEYYFMKVPRLVSVVMITVITHILIIGYELQVRRLGQAVAIATGQPYYPTDLLAPYRLAVVTAGSFVAFFWTIFPSPLKDRTWLRQDLSAMMRLLGTYFSIIVSTLKSQVEGTAGDVKSKSSPAYRMLKARRKAFGNAVRLLISMESHIEWQRWEPRIGGRFPVDQYRDILMRTKLILGYLTLMSYAVTRPPSEVKAAGSDEKAVLRPGGTSREADPGMPDVRATTVRPRILEGVGVTHHTVVSALTLISNSILSGQALPPFLPLPQLYGMARSLVPRYQGSAAPVGNSDEKPLSPIRDSKRGRGRPSLRIVDLRQGAAMRDLHLRDEQLPIERNVVISGTSETHDIDGLGESGYFIMRVCSMLVCDDLEDLMRTVSDLVGVVDFDIHHEAALGEVGETVPPPLVEHTLRNATGGLETGDKGKEGH